MDNEIEKKRKRWLERAQRLRRDYFYQKWVDSTQRYREKSLSLFKWIYDDLSYLFRWNINLLLQLYHFGSVVKNYSGLSFFGQWKRMAYLVFKMRASSNMMRYYHLFEEDRWKQVELYSHKRHNTITSRIEGFFHEKDMTKLDDKLEFYRCCLKYQWNTPKIYAAYIDGVKIYSEQEKLKYPNKDLFIKNLDAGQGKGAKYLRYENGIYRDYKGESFDLQKLTFYLERESKVNENLVIQEAEKNHDEWKKFTKGSLASCRIVTGRSLRDKEKIIPFFATFKMPVGEANGDNFSLGGFGSAIDLETGELGKAVSSKPYKNSFSFDNHPDTGEKITGEFLFRWREVLEFTKQVHRKFKVLAVGWDITLTEKGVCIIEGNPTWGSDVMEGPSGIPMTMTAYPVWVEECIELLSQNSVEELLGDN